MCEAHAFIVKNGKEELILENVDQIEINEDQVRMENIFGEQKILRAKFKFYNNSERKVLFEAL